MLNDAQMLLYKFNESWAQISVFPSTMLQDQNFKVHMLLNIFIQLYNSGKAGINITSQLLDF
jgi:hypothetical protein